MHVLRGLADLAGTRGLYHFLYSVEFSLRSPWMRASARVLFLNRQLMRVPGTIVSNEKNMDDSEDLTSFSGVISK